MMFGPLGHWWRTLARGSRGKRSRVARLYTRVGCHLCDEARAILERGGYVIEAIDVDHDPELAQRFGVEVPVVEIDGKIRFRGKVDPILLKRIRHADEESQ